MTSRNKVHFLILKHLFCCCLTLLSIALVHETYAQSSIIQKVVIDAGHGGKDPGTVHGNVMEKNVTLAVALKLGKLIKQHHPSVEVAYTREADVFVELSQRSEIANKHHADLFISIHVNAERNGTKASGSETFVMGANKTSANMAVAQLENAVITYEEDYSTKYEGFDPSSPESYIIFSLMQNVYLEQSLHFASFVQEELGNNPIKVNRGVKQAGFLVLWKTASPSVLIELGFMTNATDRSTISNDKQQDQLALAILNAFTRYKNMCEKTHGATHAETNPQATAKHPSPAVASATNKPATSSSNDRNTVYYRVQIMSINKNEPATSKIFKGHKGVQAIKAGNLYKYTLGNFTKRADAAALSNRVQKDFPGAFVVSVQDGKIVPAK